MQKIGILIGRLNPPHIGHIKIIEKSFKENDKTIIFLGSSNIIDKKNPFTYNERKKIIEKIYKESISENIIIIDFLDDNDSDKLWTQILGEKIKKHIKIKGTKVTFYGGDFQNDSAIIVIKKNLEELNINDINFTEVYRKNVLLPSGEEVSSTQIRKALNQKNINEAKKYLPEVIKNDVINLWINKKT